MLAAAFAGGWWYGAGVFADSVDRWATARRAEGWRIEAGPRRIVGFPLRWTAHYESLTIAPPAAAWSWQGHAVTVSWSLFDQSALVLGMSGTSSFDLKSDGGQLPILLDSEATDVRLDLAALPQQHATGKANRLAVTTQAYSAVAATFDFDLHFDPTAPMEHSQAAGTMRVSFERLALTPHGQQQAALPLTGSVEATLKGRPPPGPPRQAIAAWRDEGGMIELDRLDVKSGSMAVDANATIALDGEMRPLAAGTASVSGIDALMDHLIATGQMQARDVPLAKLAFSALAKPDPKTGVATVTLPVTAENGFLFLGPLKVATLKPIRLD